MTQEKNSTNDHLSERLATSGFRFTSQRERVYKVLVEERGHPTAEEVFIRVKRGSPEISMATVYNCLDTLVLSGVARQVTVDRGATRFCPNMQEHGHFYCRSCDTVFDIELPVNATVGIKLPKGFRVERYEFAVHGTCAACAKKDSAN